MKIFRRAVIIGLILTMLVSTAYGAEVKGEEYVNTALNRAAVASGEMDNSHSAIKANDGLNENEVYSSWISGTEEKPWWQLDMDVAYKISKIEIEARHGSTVTERSNFRILVSNTVDFSEFEVVSEIKTAYDAKEALSVDIRLKDLYRYVRVEKTTSGALSIGEIRVLVLPSSMHYGTDDDGNDMLMDTDTVSRFNIPFDVVGTDIERQVHLLSSLNIMRGYTDGSFMPDEYLTRAEFAAIAVRILRSEAVADNGTFSDVPSSYWAYSDIEKAYMHGLINGTEPGLFEPDANVSRSQAAKILVLILGYGEVAEQEGGYPFGYISRAIKLGVVDDSSMDETITRGEVAQMVYNTLHANPLITSFNEEDMTIAEGETLLRINFGLNYVRGVISETNGISLTDEGATIRDYSYIKIDDIIYRTENTKARDYFGYLADVYYTKERSGLLIAEAVVPMPADEIYIEKDKLGDMSSDRTLTYYDKKDRLKTINLSSDYDLIYNGRAKRNYEYATILNDADDVNVIDRDKDGKYDILIVSAVKTYLVDSIDEKSFTIFFKSIGNKRYVPIELDYENDHIAIYNKDMEEMAFTDIKEWNVISVCDSGKIGMENEIVIYVSDDFVRGAVSRINSDGTVVIKDEEYIVLPDMKNEIKAGNSGFYYFDYKGRLAGFNGKTDTDGKYGFITGLKVDDFANKSEIAIFTSGGIEKKYAAAKNLKIDGEKTNASGVYTALMNGGGTNGSYMQLIKYRLNSKDELLSIDTIYRGSNENDESLTRDYTNLRRYKAAGIYGMEFTLDEEAVIFRIPENISNVYDYEIVSQSSLRDSTYYTFEAYDGGIMKKEKVAVFLSTGSEELDATERLFVVDSFITNLNSRNEPENVLTGYYDGNYVEFPEVNEGMIAAAGLQQGDIIGLLLSGSNKIKKIEKKFFVGNLPLNAPTNSISTAKPIGPGNNTPFSDIFLAYGKVYSKEGEFIRIHTDTSGSTSNDQKRYGNIIANLNDFSIRKYIFDSEKEEVRLAENYEFCDELTYGAANASKVFFRANEAKVKDIIILK